MKLNPIIQELVDNKKGFIVENTNHPEPSFELNNMINEVHGLTNYITNRKYMVFVQARAVQVTDTLDRTYPSNCTEIYRSDMLYTQLDAVAEC